MITKGVGILCLAFTAIISLVSATPAPIAKQDKRAKGVEVGNNGNIKLTTTSLPFPTSISAMDPGHSIFILPAEPSDAGTRDAIEILKPRTAVTSAPTVPAPLPTLSPILAPGYPNCTTAPPLDNGTIFGGWPIFYSFVDLYNRSSFRVSPSWANAHYISGPHKYETRHVPTAGAGVGDNYGAFQCQYRCNDNPACASFFGQFVNVSTSEEHYECVLYNKIISPEVLLITNDTDTWAPGGYDAICPHTTSSSCVRSTTTTVPSMTPVLFSVTVITAGTTLAA